MKKRDDNMTLSVNDDSHEDLVDEMEVLILEISEDLVDLEMEKESILIWEICLEDSLDEDLDDDELKYVSEKISKKL
jgi:hypothetical protein